MASNTNYTSITDLLTSFTPTERPTRVHYNPFPEIERMNNTYRWYNYPGDKPAAEAAPAEAPAEEPVAEAAPATTVTTPVEDEKETETKAQSQPKQNLNDIVHSPEFIRFYADNYQKYDRRLISYFPINSSVTPEIQHAQYFNNYINDWLKKFDLTDNKIPIMTASENWDADMFYQDFDINTLNNFTSITNGSNGTQNNVALYRQIYRTIYAVNAFLKQKNRSTDSPTTLSKQLRMRIQLPVQPHDKI